MRVGDGVYNVTVGGTLRRERASLGMSDDLMVTPWRIQLELVIHGFSAK